MKPDVGWAGEKPCHMLPSLFQALWMLFNEISEFQMPCPVF
jgi:hypothetical protein